MEKKRGSAGGQVMAIRLRKEALDRYYKKPNVCNNCKEVIEVGEGQKVGDARKKKFCDRRCAAIFNNQGRARDKTKFVKIGKKKKYKVKKCKEEKCKELVEKRVTTCRKCIDERIKENEEKFLSRTKKEHFDSYNHYSVARARITKHSRKVFDKSDKKRECLLCGYSLHVDVAHVKDVKDYEDDATIREINHIDNLIPLCKNHHWEFDEGFLDYVEGKMIETDKKRE